MVYLVWGGGIPQGTEADPPQTRHTHPLPPDQTHHPPGPGTPPPGPDTHPQTRHTPQTRHPPDQTPPLGSRLQHTVYEWLVRIPLECILVFFDLLPLACCCSVNAQIGNNDWKRCRFHFRFRSNINAPLRFDGDVDAVDANADVKCEHTLRIRSHREKTNASTIVIGDQCEQ